jgi:hypothetical protein
VKGDEEISFQQFFLMKNGKAVSALFLWIPEPDRCWIGLGRKWTTEVPFFAYWQQPMGQLKSLSF